MAAVYPRFEQPMMVSLPLAPLLLPPLRPPLTDISARLTPLWRFPQVAEAYMKTATTGRRAQNPTDMDKRSALPPTSRLRMPSLHTFAQPVLHSSARATPVLAGMGCRYHTQCSLLDNLTVRLESHALEFT